METRIQKWGNSVGIRIPKTVLKKYALREGSSVLIDDTKSVITIKKNPVAKPSLKNLVDEITSANIHKEQMSDTPRGN